MQCSTPEPQTPQGLTLHHASAGPQPGSPGADMHNATPSLAPINRACLYSARALQHAGLAWAPVISGVKHPSAYDSEGQWYKIRWKHGRRNFATQPGTMEECEAFFNVPWPLDVAILTGKPSGKIIVGVQHYAEVLDIEQQQVFAEMCERIREAPFPDLFNKLTLEHTRRGGHISYLHQFFAHRVVIARDANDKLLIETFNNEAICVIAPSQGYTALQGTYTQLQAITPDERDWLQALCRSYDARPTTHQRRPKAGDRQGEGSETATPNTQLPPPNRGSWVRNTRGLRGCTCWRSSPDRK